GCVVRARPCFPRAGRAARRPDRLGDPRNARPQSGGRDRTRIPPDLVIVLSLPAVADAWPAGMVVAVALFGLAIGSFLNVVIARVPTGRSLVHPGSACQAAVHHWRGTTTYPCCRTCSSAGAVAPAPCGSPGAIRSW